MLSRQGVTLTCAGRLEPGVYLRVSTVTVTTRVRPSRHYSLTVLCVWQRFVHGGNSLPQLKLLAWSYHYYIDYTDVLSSISERHNNQVTNTISPQCTVNHSLFFS